MQLLLFLWQQIEFHISCSCNYSAEKSRAGKREEKLCNAVAHLESITWKSMWAPIYYSKLHLPQLINFHLNKPLTESTHNKLISIYTYIFRNVSPANNNNNNHLIWTLICDWSCSTTAASSLLRYSSSIHLMTFFLKTIGDQRPWKVNWFFFLFFFGFLLGRADFSSQGNYAKNNGQSEEKLNANRRCSFEQFHLGFWKFSQGNLCVGQTKTKKKKFPRLL